MADTRTYARIDDHMPENEKIIPLSDAAAWMHVSGILYCSRNLTDGKVPKKIISRLVHGNARKLVQELVTQNLWEDTGDFYEIHDYLEHQRSRADIEEMRRKARERAAKSRRTSRVTDGEVTEPEAEATTDTEAFGSSLKSSSSPPSSNGHANGGGVDPDQIARLQRTLSAQFEDVDVQGALSLLKLRLEAGERISSPVLWTGKVASSMAEKRKAAARADEPKREVFEGEWHTYDREQKRWVADSEQVPT